MYLGWDTFAIMGITISFLIVTLIFMLSYLFNIEFLKSWSRSEFLNIFITLIMFGSLISILQLGIARENLSSGRSYVNRLFNDVLDIMINLISDISVISFIGSFSININPGGMIAMQNQVDTDKGGGGIPVSGYISMNSFVSPIITSFSNIQIYSFIPLLMIKLHILLIDFVADDVEDDVENVPFPIFLALGIFLRAFKFSRGAGNTMIAIFMALYLILPSIYLFNLGLMNVIYGNTGDKEIFEFHSFGEDATANFMPDLTGVLMDELSTGSDFDVSDVTEFNDSDLGEKMIEMTSPDGSLYNFIMRFVIEAFFLPYLSIIVTLGIAREFALSLGTNVDFSSLVRLV